MIITLSSSGNPTEDLGTALQTLINEAIFKYGQYIKMEYTIENDLIVCNFEYPQSESQSED